MSQLEEKLEYRAPTIKGRARATLAQIHNMFGSAEVIERLTDGTVMAIKRFPISMGGKVQPTQIWRRTGPGKEAIFEKMEG